MATRDAVLAALRAAGSAGVSGEALARELGVSRVAVGKHVSALREAGYEIEAEPGVGYRLLGVPDAPLPGEIAPLLREASWMTLLGGGPTGSTNDDARILAREGAAEGSVVLASAQATGRGRLGRRWESPVGGAYFSAIVRPRVAPGDVAPLALVIALGIARGLAEHLRVEVELKWPNDVLLSGGKLAGVLLEMAAEADRVDWVVVGVGLNVRRPADVEPSPGAVFLGDAVAGLRVAPAVAAVLEGIATAYAEWIEGGFAPLRAEYEARSTLVGHSVTVSDMAAHITASGTVMGVDDNGRLLLATLGGVEAISAGEVTLREPA